MDKVVAAVGVALLVSSGVSMAVQNADGGDGCWERRYDGMGNGAAADIVPAHDGGFAVVGSTASTVDGQRDMWLLKLDSQGNREWERFYGGAQSERAWSLVRTDDGYLLGGYVETSGLKGEEFWLIRVGEHGHMIWNRTYGGGGDQKLDAVITTADGGYAAAGRTSSADNPGDVWLLKIDGAGNVAWTRSYGGAEMDVGTDIVATSDGYLIGGRTDSYASHGGWDSWLIKTDGQGHEEWNRTYGWNKLEFCTYIEETPDGYVLAGYTETADRWGEAYLIKVTRQGEEQWKRRYGGWSMDQIDDFKAIEDGYILAGGTDSYGLGDFDAWLLKIDTDGTELWNKSFGQREADWAHAVLPVDSGYLWVGHSNVYHPLRRERETDAWIVKCDDAPPPTLAISRPKDGHLYLFDMEIMPYEQTIAIGGITVTAETGSPGRIDRVAFYVTGYDIYEHRPRAVISEPPYQWKCRRLGMGQPIQIIAGGYYGQAGGVAVDKQEIRIFNMVPG